MGVEAFYAEADGVHWKSFKDGHEVPGGGGPRQVIMGSSSDFDESMASLEANANCVMAMNRYYDYQQPFSTTFLDTKSPGHRAVCYSLKPDITKVAASDSGELTRLRTLRDSVPAGTKVYWSLWHEPEDDGLNTADYRTAWQVFHTLMHETSNANFHTIWIMMSFSWDLSSGRDPMQWYPGDAYCDYVGFDTYNEGSLHNPQRWDSWGLDLGRPQPGESTAPKGGGYVYGGPITWSESHGKQWMICEWGTITNHNAPTPAWCTALGIPATKASWLLHGMDWFLAFASFRGMLLFNSKGRTWTGDGVETWPLDRVSSEATANYSAWGAKARQYGGGTI